MSDLTKLFKQINSEVLTEDLKIQMSVLFESRLTEAIKSKEQKLDESNKVDIAEFKDNLINQMDEYLHYFIEEYVRENRTQIVESTKVKQAAKILETMSKLTNEFNISLSPVNENKAKDRARISSLQDELNKSINENIKTKNKVNDLKRSLMIAEKANVFDIDSQREKFVKLTESVKFEDESQFIKAINTVASMVRNTSPAKKVQKIVESKKAEKVEKKIVTESKSDPAMSQYLERV